MQRNRAASLCLSVRSYGFDACHTFGLNKDTVAEHGASLSVVDSSGDTALHLACKNGKNNWNKFKFFTN